MTQQTINGTVYKVGQVLHTMTEAGPFIDAWVEANKVNGYDEHPVSKGNNAYPVSRIHSSILPVKIEFLPNPAPVAEKPTPLTREELVAENERLKAAEQSYCRRISLLEKDIKSLQRSAAIRDTKLAKAKAYADLMQAENERLNGYWMRWKVRVEQVTSDCKETEG